MAKRLTNYLEALSANAPVKLRLGTSLARKVAQWMAVNGHTDLAYAIKDLVSIGLAASPEDGVRYHGMTSRLEELKREWLKATYRFITIEGERLEKEILALDAKPEWATEAYYAHADAAARLHAETNRLHAAATKKSGG